ncbi:hypothetical protein QUB63_08780 [Microcoleus sp. ARI1-B5]|uniref:hypothetical protein n=1 Tax=unclassified Microcoleus TaxID=2642155 RepID=UPI002FD759C4
MSCSELSIARPLASLIFFLVIGTGEGRGGDGGRGFLICDRKIQFKCCTTYQIRLKYPLDLDRPRSQTKV